MNERCQQPTKKLGLQCKYKAVTSHGVQFEPEKEIKVVWLCQKHSDMFVEGKLTLYK